MRGIIRISKTTEKHRAPSITIWHLLFFVVVALLLSYSTVNAREFFLSSDGKDSNPGTLELPWCTLEKASQAARPGDTVYLMPGTYSGVLHPVRSGCKGSPITFCAKERRTAELIGPPYPNRGRYAINLEGLSYVKIKGLDVRPKNWNGRWLLANKTDHITIIDCLMEESSGDYALAVKKSDQFRVIDSVFRKHYSNNMMRFSDSTNILIEGNAISRSGHSPLQLYPPGSNRYVVIRGNVFHAAWGRNFELFEVPDVLFEHNIITNAYNGGHSADTKAKFLVNHGIFRFNQIFRNWDIPIDGFPYKDNLFFRHARFYNNVFHDNHGPGILIAGPPVRTQDIVFQNNVFYNNDPFGSGCQVRITEGEKCDIKFWNNIITSERAEASRAIWFDKALLLDISQAERDYLEQFNGNHGVLPCFEDELQYDYTLKKESPLRNAGRPLSYAVDSGQGISLRVKDASFFYDGFGIESELGDLVAIGTPEQVARIIKVDREQNILTLDHHVTWSKGNPVSLPWVGSAPDIGVFEYGGGAGPFVRVEAKPIKAQTGQPVHLQAKVVGIDPVEVRWYLGDGTIYNGFDLNKTYNEAYDYPVRVCVTDKQGHKYYGVSYVIVEESSAVPRPLVHNTFSKDDDEWWWRWQAYRPTPAAHELANKSVAGDQSLHIYAPEDGGELPARIHPAEWDIDCYPTVFLRYSITPKTPIALYLRGFKTPKSNQCLCVAKTPSADIKNDKQIGTMLLLHDDGAWHELTIDVRNIRERFPNVSVLKGLWIQAAGTDFVKKGQGYWIDEFIIRPDVSQEIRSPTNIRIE
ncbi:MAG: hypothetical protein C4B58_05130 [Deltaproteobacteria bacterium]|nr:MAG: hypothetical protein C4B58_05130 [Deltaproteobacteria bacterium]